AKYKAKLVAGGRASGRFVPPIIYAAKKTTLLSKYQNQKQKLVSKIKNTSEKDLDLYILPHPLLGKITLREMLFFTVYHNEHHLNILKSRMETGV
ncbi:MAG: DinB family protein, partial [Bacteroidota bacterium]